MVTPFTRVAQSAISSPRLWALLLASTALTIPQARATESLPGAGQVVVGSVSIGTGGKTTTITQSTDKAIVNWNSFSIGQGYTVEFIQPGAASAILNRVTGSTRSSIAGTLKANGQVYLINPNGIAITATGTVKAGGGFVASTLDLADQDFLNGKLSFLGNGTSSEISNDGIISIGRGGYAALIGGRVRNDGVIAVSLGKVGLGAGEQATLDLSGDGFLQVAMPTQSAAQGALIANTGTVVADGGTVVMAAAVARNAARNAINLGGVIQADSVGGRDGTVVIGGGQGGAVEISGTIRANAVSGTGGSITVTGDSIALTGATIDTSGTQRGGSIRIGGDKQGQGTTQRATTTSVDQATIIHADATDTGTGGQVVVWSDEKTNFDGLITARGAGTGSGGDAEVSGKALLSYKGFTDLSGVGGFGTLLLDPYNITISNGAASNSTGTTATGNDSVINVSTLQTALSAANVTVTTGAAGSGGSQVGNITVADAVTWSSGSTLSLSAYGNIAVNANLTGGTGASIVLRADNAGTGTGTVTFGSGVKATASGGVSLYCNPAGNDASSVNSTSYKTATDYSAYAGSVTAITAYMLVNTVHDLQNIANTLSGTYALGRDIDASATASWNDGAGFKPIGNATTPFTGTFDGLSHTISDLTINRATDDDVGLFGYLGNLGNRSGFGQIGNVGLVGGSITGHAAVGGLVGGTEIGTTITNAYATATVAGTGAVGGLVGLNGSTITSAYATGAVTGSGGNVGGLVGSSSGKITNAYATGAVTGNDNVGGLVGYNLSRITNTYATGAVTGSSGTGGLVGRNSTAVSNSFWDKTTTGQASGFGEGFPGPRTGATGLTTAQARVSSNFTDWDFSTDWYQAGDMRPILRSEATAAVNGVITVSNLHQLALIGANLSGSYVLSANIDARATAGTAAAGIWSTAGFVPIGDATTKFTGTFDGQGHIISRLNINRGGTSFVGLFGYVNSSITTGSAIRNVGLVGGNITGANFVGGLVGYSNNSITNVYTTGNVSGGFEVGGLVGASDGDITNAYTSGTVTGSMRSGGLVGGNDGSITNAYATGAVMGAEAAGGLVGYNFGHITNTYATGAVTGTTQIGGLVGLSASSGTINSSFWNTTTSGKTTGVGSGSATGVTGLTTSQFQSTADFMNQATGWDFNKVWAPPSAGYSPVLYALTPVVWVKATTTSSTYGDNSATPVVAESYGGTASYVFGPAGDSLTFTGGTVTISPTAAAGTTTTSLAAQNAVRTSTKGTDYRAFYYGDNTATVAKATLTITAGNGQMMYGGTIPTLTYSVSGWKNSQGDSLLSGVGVTANATATSNVGTRYETSASGGTLAGAAAGNYNLAYANGTFSVTQRAITVTGDKLSRVYGDSNPALTYALTSGSLVNGDTLAGTVTGTLTTTASTSSNVGDYAITQGSLAASGNYALTYAAGTLKVSQRAITVIGDKLSRTYGASNPTLTYAMTSGSLVNGDTLAGTVTGALATTASTSSNVGDYTVTQGSLAASGNYALTYAAGTLTVNKAALTVTVNGSQTYGAADPTYTIQGIGWKNGQGNANLTGITYSTSATATSNAGGSYTASGTGGTLTGAAAGNYDITYQAGTLTVNKAALTVTVNGSQTYGTATPTYTAQGTGWKNGQGDTNLTGITYSTTATATSNVGADYTANGSGGTLTGAAADNYNISYLPGTFTVNKAILTANLTGSVTKTYDGTNTATLTTGNYQLTGIVGSDSVSVATTAGLYDSKNAGNGKTVTVANLTLAGAAAANYDISGTVSGAVGTISKARLTASLTGSVSKTYDGTSTAKLTPENYQLSGIIGSEHVSVSTTTGLYDSKNARGGRTVTVANLSLVGADAANYTISGTASGPVGSISKAALTVTATDAAKIYDGGAYTGGSGVTYTGFVNGETDAVLGGSLAYSGTSQGAVMAETYVLSATGRTSDNYDIAYVSGSLNVNKRPITVTADSQNTVYGNTVPTLSYAVGGSGLVRGDSLTGALATTAGSTTNVGTYAITQGTLAASTNYALTYAPGTLTVTQRAITVTGDTLSRTYGDSNPALTYALNSGTLINGDSLTGTVATAADTRSGVGSYAITQGSLTASANYALTYKPGTLKVDQRSITVTGDKLSRTYGDSNPTLTYAVTNGTMVNGDTLAGALATTADGRSGVNTYVITQGSLASDNYALTYKPGTLTVSQRALTVTGDKLSRTYGDSNPALTYALTNGTLVNGDSLTGAVATTADTSSGVGTYAVTQGSLAASANYALTYAPGALTVTQRAITVTGDKLSRTYGDGNPTLTYALTNGTLVNGDSLTGAVATTADTSSGVGTYAVTQGSLAASANYALTYAPGALTVTQRAITVTGDKLSRTYGDGNPTLTYALTNGTLVNGDSLTGAVATTADTSSGVGTYAVTQGSLAASANYALTYAPGALTVSQRALTVTGGKLSRTYGDGNPTLTYALTNGTLVNGDSLTGAVATTADTSSGVGTYAVTQGSLAASANYALTYAPGALTVTQRAITVTGDKLSRTYGDGNPTLTYALTNGTLVNGDSLTGAVATTADTSSGVGTYAVTQGSLAASANYALTYAPGALTVTQRAITVTGDKLSRTYGDGNPTLTYALTNGTLVNGDSLTGAVATTVGATSGVGTYAVTQGSLIASANYALTYAPGALTVTQRAITVTGDDLSRTYGTSNPTLTYSLTNGSLVNGDTLAGSPTTTAGTTSAVGTYALTQGSLIASANYALTFIQGTLTVTAQPAAPLAGIFSTSVITPQAQQSQTGLAQIVTYQVAQQSVSSTDPRLDGAVCFIGANFAISCSQ